MQSKDFPRSRRDEIVIQNLLNEVLIYDLKINKAYCLNETSASVWQMCDGSKTVAEISKQLTRKLGSPITEDLVWLAVDELAKKNLLDKSREIKTKFEGLSRREAIRRVGLISMIALPVISSLVAPTAAMAQSSGVTCTPIGEPCNDSDECCEVSGIKNCQEDCFTGEKVCVAGFISCP